MYFFVNGGLAAEAEQAQDEGGFLHFCFFLSMAASRRCA
jgi:hypothetical protein